MSLEEDRSRFVRLGDRTVHRKERAVTEHEQRSEEEVVDEQEAETVEDLDVPEDQEKDVAGGKVTMQDFH
jgi:hypothetical protein